MMRRRTFDLLMTSVGLMVTVVLLVAGGLLVWGYNFANDSVRDQLSEQLIYFPPKGSEELASPEIGPYLDQYAGQQLVNGEQAKAYADHFIAVHLDEVADGQTYAQVSAKVQQDPTNVELQAQASVLFRGEALRGLLLNAYAFWQIGQIALYAAIASFILAAIMLTLSILGFWHLRRAAPEDQILIG